MILKTTLLKTETAKNLFRALLCTSLLSMATYNLAAPAIEFELIGERTHKTSLFTQGLLVDGDHFYESSGLYGKSLLVSYPVAEPQGSTWAKISAPFTRKLALPPQYFAEGLTLLDNQLYLLTWREQTLLVYDKNTFSLQRQFNYQGEGWGLATDGKQLIRSDGSDRLFFHRVSDFSITRELQVTDGGKPVSQLNELEYAQGFIWANVWHQDRILKIDPATGKVLGEVNLQALKHSLKLGNGEQVLNGIAWDEQQQAFWVTGKLWPKMFLLRLQH